MASACCLGAETCFRNSRPTCSNLCEPGGAGVKVDGLEADHLARLAGLADGHTHQRILLLRDHQHLKHFQWTGKGEVEVLQQKEDREGFASVEFWCVLCCFIPQGRASCSISALSPIKQSTGTWIIGISEYRSNGHFYLRFKNGTTDMCGGSFKFKAYLDKHKPLHGLIPLQQDNPRLQRSTQVLVACIRISHWEVETTVTKCGLIVCIQINSLKSEHVD